MPFSHQSEVFEADELARMTDAYNCACAELARTAITFNPEDLADAIIVLVRTADLDSDQLAQSAIKRMQDPARRL